MKDVEERGRDVLLHAESEDTSDVIHSTVHMLADSVQSLRQQAEDHITQLQVESSVSYGKYLFSRPYPGIKSTLPLTKKGKGKFLYSAVSSPQDRSKRFTLYFPDRPVHSDTISASLGSIQPCATINARRLLVQIPTTVYSQVLIYTAELTGVM